MIYKLLKAFLFFIVIPIIFLVGLVQTRLGREAVTRYITKRIEKEIGLQVSVKDARFFLPFGLQAQGIAISQEEERILDIKRMVIRLAPLALIRGHPTFYTIYLDDVTHKGGSKKSSSSLQFSWKQLPKKLKIYDLKIQNFTSYALSPAPIDIQGRLFLDAKRRYATANISAVRGSEDHASLLFSCEQEPDQLLKGNFQLDYTSPHQSYGNWSGAFTFEDLQTALLTDVVGTDGPLTGKFEGTLKLPPENLLLNLHSQNPEIHGHSLEDFLAEARITLSDENTEGSFRLAFKDEHGSWDAETSLKKEGEANWHVSDLTVKAPKILIEGDLSVNPEQMTAVGLIEGHMEDLSVLSPLVGVNLQGSCTIKTESQPDQNISLILEAESLKIGDLTIHHVQAKGDLNDPLEVPEGHFKVGASYVKYRNMNLTDFAFETDMGLQKERWPYKLSASGDLEGEIRLESSGSWQTNFTQLIATIETYEGKALGYDFSLADPIELQLAPRILELSPILMLIDKGSFYAAIEQVSNTVHTTLRIQNIPLEPMRLAFPSLAATGSVTADVFLFGSPSDLKGQLRAEMSDVKIKEDIFAKLSPLEIEIAASLFGDTLQCTATINGIGDQPVELDTKLPFTCSLTPLAVKVGKEGSLHAHVSAGGPITPLLQLVAPDHTNMSGHLDVAIDVGGTVAQPHAVGHAKLTDGFFEGYKSGILFQNIQAEVEGDGTKLVLKDLQGDDGRGGKLSGQGSIALDFARHFPFEMDLIMANAALIRLDTTQASVSGNLNFQGNTQEATLSGNIHANALQYTLPEQIPELVHAIEVTYVNQLPHERPPTIYTETPSSYPLSLDLMLEVPGNARFVGDNLTSEWKGQIAITGTDDHPILKGKLKAEKGHYIFNGRKFDVKKGTVTFDGDPVAGTHLYVIGAMDIDRITAEVVVKGPISGLTIALRSTPPLPQRDILSWILFNKGMSEITPFQGDQLSEAVVDLSKTKNKDPDILTKIRNNFGIDKIDINRDDSSENHDISVEVGKYVSNDTFISVKKNMTTEANQVCIGTNLFSHFKLEAEVADDSTGQVNLLWRNDY